MLEMNLGQSLRVLILREMVGRRWVAELGNQAYGGFVRQCENAGFIKAHILYTETEDVVA